MHLPLPHLPVPAVLLSVVYGAAVAVALTHPGGHTLAGLVVLAGLVARWAVCGRRAGVAAGRLGVAATDGVDTVDAVRPPEPAPAAAA